MIGGEACSFFFLLYEEGKTRCGLRRGTQRQPIQGEIKAMNAMILCRTMLVVVFLMMTPSGSWAKEKNASLAELQQQAKKGQANAQYKLGVLYDQGQGVKQDYGQARKWWLKAAEQGNAAAQVSLGLLYNKSHGVKQDYGQARKWWLKAAEEGNADAQLYLGSLYEYGQGVKRDYEQARKWWLKAAEQGNANAQVNLAVLYSMGRGVPEDLVEAYAWANVAAGQGLKSGVTLRKRIKQRLAPASLAEAQAQSKMYHEKYAGPNR